MQLKLSYILFTLCTFAITSTSQSQAPVLRRWAKVYINNEPEATRVLIRHDGKFNYAYLPSLPIVRASVEVEQDIPVKCFFWKRSANILLRGSSGSRGSGSGSGRQPIQDTNIVQGGPDDFISLPFAVDDPLITPFPQANRVYCYDRSRYLLRGIGESAAGTNVDADADAGAGADADAEIEIDDPAVANEGGDDIDMSTSGDDTFDIATLFVENARGKRELVRVPIPKQDQYGELDMIVSYPTLCQGVINVAVVEEADALGPTPSASSSLPSSPASDMTGQADADSNDDGDTSASRSFSTQDDRNQAMIRGACYLTLDTGELVRVSMGQAVTKLASESGVVLRRITCFRNARRSEPVERWRSED